MVRTSMFQAFAAAGLIGGSFACTLPAAPPPTDILDKFSVVLQNPAIPVVHNKVIRVRPNGDDEHIVLAPMGEATGDAFYLKDGLFSFRDVNPIHGVIDLEYAPWDNTTKLFMTARTYHPSAIFRSVWGCNPDTDVLQIELELVSRQLDPPVLGGELGIRLAVDTYELRYSPPANPILNDEFMPVTLVICRGTDCSTTANTSDSGTVPTSTPTPTPTTTPTPTVTPPTSTPPTSTSTTEPPSSSTTPPTSTSTTEPPSSSTTPPTSTSTTEPPSSSTTPPASSSSTTTPAPTSTAFPDVGVYSHVSCWAEPADGRTLTAAVFSTDDMTLEKCSSLCSSYPYFGTQWSRECYCGDDLTDGSAAAPETDCNMACSGDASELCGGGRRLSLYHNEQWTGPEVPDFPEDVGTYKYYGCITDSREGRSLSSALFRSDSMTLNQCAGYCATNAYEFFGVEYGTECWCAHQFTGAPVSKAASECNMVCPGNANQRCGAGDRLSVYTTYDPAIFCAAPQPAVCATAI